MNRYSQFYYDLVTKSNIKFEKVNNSTFVNEHLYVIIQLDNKIRIESSPQRVHLGDFPFEVYDNVHDIIVSKYKSELSAKVDALKYSIQKLQNTEEELYKTSDIKTICNFLNFDYSEHISTELDFNGVTTVLFKRKSKAGWTDEFTILELSDINIFVKEYAKLHNIKPNTVFKFID